MSGVEIRVRANARQATNELGKLERSLKNIETKVNATSKAFSRLAIGITAAVTGNALVKGITRSADAMTNLQNRVNLVTKDLKKTNIVMKDLFNIAARSRSSVDAVALTFNKFGLALADSGKPMSELLAVTEAVQQAAVISGAGAESAKAAITQLGQGLASGQLRGEELNSVLEQMPRLAKTIAEGMGIPFSKLRKEAMDGNITAQAVFQAILDGAGDLEAEFNTLDATVSGLATVFGNEWTRAIANLDKSIGVSAGIKEKIMLATQAVRYFGENIQLWSALATANLIALKYTIKFFAMDVLDFFKSIFSSDFDSGDFTQNMIDKLNGAKEKIKETGGIAIDFSIQKIDLIKDMLPNLSSVISQLTTFKKNIVDIFFDIWDRIVGQSYWTGIFDPMHRESGQKLAIGSDISTYLAKPLGQLKSWGTELKTFFSNLYMGVSTSWTSLIDEIDARGFSTVATENMSSAWSSAIDSMSTAWDNFGDATFDRTGVSIPFFDDMVAAFNSTTTTITDNFHAFVEVLKGTPLVVGAIKIGTSVAESLDGLKDRITNYFDDNADVIAALISGALGVALNKRLRTMAIKRGILGAFLGVANILGNDAEFLEAAKTAARGWGKAIGDALSGEGDVVADILSGVYNIAEAVGKGFVDGMWPEDSNTWIKDALGTALTLGIGAYFLAPAVTSKLVGLGLSMAGWILGTQFVTSLVAKMTLSITTMSRSAILAAGIRAAGLSIGTSLQSYMLLGVTGGLALLLSDAVTKASDSAARGLGRLLTGETAEQQNVSKGRELLEDTTSEAMAAISYGAVNLEDVMTLTSDELDTLKTSIGEVDDSLYDSVVGMLGFASAAEKATKIIDEALERKATAGVDAVLARASGGRISGPGTSTSDSIPAMLSDGEYVIQQSAVSKFGTGFMDRINAGIAPIHRAGGGTASTISRLKSLRGEALVKGDFVALDVLNDQIASLLALTEEQTLVLEEGGAAASTLIDTEEEKKGGKKGKGKKERTPQDIAEDYAEGLQREFQNAFTNLLSTGDIKGFFGSLADSFTMSIIESFSESFTTSLFDGLTGEGGFLTNIFKGMGDFGKSVGETTQEGVLGAVNKVGGAGFFSDIFSSISGFLSGIFGGFGGGTAAVGMSQGGTVPNVPGSQAGKDSVPAMLMPGEVVLSKNDLRSMNNTSSGASQSTFNINVTGDITRQTRQEIAKMIPQITTGVNMQNKEANYRR